MSAPTLLEAAVSLEWQAKYIRRATAVADALAHFAAGEQKHRQARRAALQK
nr:hypothetical protein [Acetobacter persici]